MKFNLLGNVYSSVAKVALAMQFKAMHGNTRKQNYSTRKILLFMRLVFLFTIIACLQSWSAGHGQALTLSLKDAPLEKVFHEIRKQSSYSFVYTKEQLTGGKTVTFSVSNATIETVMKLCVRDQPITYEISENYIVIKSKPDFIQASANRLLLDLRGTVLGENEQPLAGATVTVKGNNRSAITDENGIFQLMGVEDDAVLIISSVGYIPLEYKLTGAKEIAIQLKVEIGELGGVSVKVNTGYQTLNKERSTGSFTSIDNKTFNHQVSTGIVSRLEGVANSFSVNRKGFGPGQIMIRGLSTINGPKSPLIVIDNFPYEGDINNINPNDVESITILKDAAASSIWGTRAGNGVIVITTKRGQFNQPVKIELNTNLTVMRKPDLYYLKSISPKDYVDVEIFLYGKGYFNNQFNSFYKEPISPVAEILKKRELGQISSADSARLIDEFTTHDVRSDFEKYMYRDAINQQYSLTTNGGSKNIAWVASAGYDKNLSTLCAGYRRLNLRLDNTYKFSDRFRLATSFYFTEGKTDNGNPGFYEVSTNNGRIPIYTRFADKNGKALPVVKEYRQTFIDTFGGGRLLDWSFYPLTDHQNVQGKTRLQDIIANAGFNYRILTGLEFELKYQYEKQESKSEIIHNLQSYTARNIINLFTNLTETEPNLLYPVPRKPIYDFSNSALISHKGRAQVNFNKVWATNSIAIIAGSEIGETRNKGTSGRLYGYDKNILSYVKMDYVNFYPTSINGSLSAIPDNVSLSDRSNRFISFYSNAAFTYKSKYTLSASARRDASNLFGVSTNDKWKPLWSAGASWILSNEGFYNVDFVPYLRVRATYGHSGNVDQSRSAVTTIQYLGTSPNTQEPFARFSQYSNPGLRWENISQFNIGLDFRSKNNVVTGSIEIYQKNATDLYGPSLVDYTGVSTPSIVKNVASMTARGFDLELNTVNVKTNNFSWVSRYNFNLYRDRIVSYYLASVEGGNLVNGGTGIASIVGKPVYSIFSYKWAGLDKASGDPLGYVNGHVSNDYSAITGTIQSISDVKYNGPAFPSAFGSLANTFTWKSLSLTTLFMYEFGAFFQRSSINYSLLFGNRNGHSDYSLRWKAPGDEVTTNVPSLVYPENIARDNFYNSSEILIEKADNIRFKYINISYVINGNKTIRLPASILQVYASLSDIGIVWRANRHKLDPSIEATSFPVRMSISIGVKANF